MTQNCGNCRWSDWPYETPTGRPKKDTCGFCNFPVQDLESVNKLPLCVTLVANKRIVLPTEHGCPTWETRAAK